MKILMLFGGQGYHKRDLFDVFSTDEIGLSWINSIEKQLHFSLKENVSKLNDAAFTQLFISYYQLGICSLINETIKGHDIYLAGYSLGETSAYLYSLGANATEITSCIQYRTTIMTDILEKKPLEKYDLISISGNFSFNTIKALCDDYHCHVAIIISQNHVVVGGKMNDLHRMLQEKKLENYLSKFLSINLPSHTPYYKNQSAQFETYLLSHFKNKPMRFPIISALDKNIIWEKNREITLLSRSLSETLQWEGVNQFIDEYRFEIIIDIGPGTAMSSMLESTTRYTSYKIIRVADFKTIKGLWLYLDRILLLHNNQNLKNEAPLNKD